MRTALFDVFLEVVCGVVRDCCVGLEKMWSEYI